MPWTAIFAVVALLGLQLAIAAASLYAYNRIRGKEDIAGQQREAWSAKLELAVSNADSARRQVETIEVSHYKALSALFQQQSLELSEMRSKLKQMEMELATCRAKLASEERMTRRAVAKSKAAAAPDGEEDPADPTLPTGLPANPTIEDLRKLGLAVPMSPVNQAPAQQPASFGKVAR
jgi:hypothetical protein